MKRRETLLYPKIHNGKTCGVPHPFTQGEFWRSIGRRNGIGFLRRHDGKEEQIAGGNRRLQKYAQKKRLIRYPGVRSKDGSRKSPAQLSAPEMLVVKLMLWKVSPSLDTAMLVTLFTESLSFSFGKRTPFSAGGLPMRTSLLQCKEYVGAFLPTERVPENETDMRCKKGGIMVTQSF